MANETTDDLLVDLGARRFSVAFSVMFFVFGTAAGFLLAFTGLGFLEDSAATIAGVFLVLIVALALAGLGVYALRRRILSRLFGIAQAQVDVFAGPLAEVAAGAARRDPEQAAQSARRLIQVALARYAWLATRRWIITSLTALIAAMAALAGTALLFKQNALLGEQIVLLAEQNWRIQQQNELLDRQTMMLSQDIELTEAARNAGLAVEVTSVAALLGEAADRATAAGGTGTSTEVLPVIDVRRDLERSLIFRVIAVSQAFRPYRFLEPGINVANDADRIRHALFAQRDAAPDVWARVAQANGWEDADLGTRLIDRPASPERGQLLRVMLANGVHDLDLFNFYGLDLSFAYAQSLSVTLTSLRHAMLPFADLSYASLAQTDLSGARLSSVRFRRAQILRCILSSIAPQDVREPFSTDQAISFSTEIAGADFSNALIVDTTFARAQAIAAIFDRALMIAPDFTGTALSVASFHGAILVNPRWQGAFLAEANFDGAFVFGADPLGQMAAEAATDTFSGDRYRAEPVDAQTVLAGSDWDYLTPDGLTEMTHGLQAWRLVRVQP